MESIAMISLLPKQISYILSLILAISCFSHICQGWNADMVSVISFYGYDPYPSWLNGTVVGVLFCVQIFVLLLVLCHILRYILGLDRTPFLLGEKVYIYYLILIVLFFLLAMQGPLLDNFGALVLPLFLHGFFVGTIVSVSYTGSIVLDKFKKKPVPMTFENQLAVIAGNLMLLNVGVFLFVITHIPI